MQAASSRAAPLHTSPQGRTSPALVPDVRKASSARRPRTPFRASRHATKTILRPRLRRPSVRADCAAPAAATVAGSGGGKLSVAIIGGGVAGVATCKALAARGIPCTLFEPQPRVGGLWVANYPGACIQDLPSQYEFPDMPFPASVGDRATAEDVCRLCEAYVREWELEGHLRLGTHVERVTRRPGGGFAVSFTEAGGSQAAEDFTHVVVSTGTFSSTPRIPGLPGLSTFRGLLLHSSKRRDDAAELRGRRVMVVGGGKSAQEAAAAAVRAGAASVVHSQRATKWTLPTRFFGVVPYTWVLHNRALQKSLPVYPGDRPLPPWQHAIRAACAPLRWLMRQVLQAVLLLHYRLPRRLWPRAGPDDLLGLPVFFKCTWAFLRGVRDGKIDSRVAEVANIGPSTVMLRHAAQEGQRAGTEEEFPVDTLILATGFADGHPFLGDDIHAALGRQADGLPLYRNIVPPNLPGLLFVGHVTSFTLGVTVSVQAAWVAEVLQGSITLPSADAMHADIRRWAAATARGPLSPLRRHRLVTQSDRYNAELARDMGVANAARYGGPFGAFANAVLPQHAAQYGAALQPLGQRARGALRPPLWLKAATVAAVSCAGRVLLG